MDSDSEGHLSGDDILQEIDNQSHKTLSQGGESDEDIKAFYDDKEEDTFPPFTNSLKDKEEDDGMQRAWSVTSAPEQEVLGGNTLSRT